MQFCDLNLTQTNIYQEYIFNWMFKNRCIFKILSIFFKPTVCLFFFLFAVGFFFWRINFGEWMNKKSEKLSWKS